MLGQPAETHTSQPQSAHPDFLMRFHLKPKIQVDRGKYPTLSQGEGWQRRGPPHEPPPGMGQGLGKVPETTPGSHQHRRNQLLKLEGEGQGPSLRSRGAALLCLGFPGGHLAILSLAVESSQLHGIGTLRITWQCLSRCPRQNLGSQSHGGLYPLESSIWLLQQLLLTVLQVGWGN